MPNRKQADDRHGIADALGAIRRKLWLRRFTRDSLWGLFAGGGTAILTLVLSRVVPIWYPWLWALGWCGLGLVVGLICGLVRRPTVYEAARYADRNGLQERMLTALRFTAVDSPMATIQRRDALYRMRREESRILQQIKVWRLPRWLVGCFGGYVLLAAALWWLPNPMAEIVLQQQQIEAALDTEQQRVAEMEQEIAQNDELSPEMKEALQEELEALREQLQASESVQDGLKAMAEAEDELDRLARQTTEDAQVLAQLRERLAARETTSDLAQALADGQASELADAVRQTEEAITQMTDEQRESLAAMLTETADEVSESGGPSSAEKMAEALRNASDAIRSGEATQVRSSLQDVANQTLTASQSAQTSQDAIARVSRSIAGSKQALVQTDGPGTSNENQVAQGGQGNGNHPGQGNDVSGESGEQSEPGGTNGSGAESGPSGSAGGNGSGSGSGNTPSGSGSSGNSSGTGGGAGLGSGSRERVSVPTNRLDGDGPEETVGGPLDEGQETVQSGGYGIGSPGVSRPYSEVFGSYETAAREALERNDLPPQLQQLVKQYFSDLDPDGAERRDDNDE